MGLLLREGRGRDRREEMEPEGRGRDGR